MTETIAGTYIYPEIVATMQKHSLSAQDIPAFLCGENNLSNSNEIVPHKNLKVAQGAIAYGKTKKVAVKPAQIRTIIEEQKNNFRSQ